MIGRLIDRVKDWKIQIAQTILPLFVIPLSILFDIPAIFKNVVLGSEVDIQELPVWLRVVIAQGKWVIMVALLIYIYYKVRKHNMNENVVLKQTLNKSVMHSYAGYWFCRWILCYKKISLTLVPIPMQYKLVIKGVFDNYEYMENINEEINEDADSIRCEEYNTQSYTSTVNLILMDTYPIDDWKSKIPPSCIDYSSIVVDRSGKRGVRCYSKNFVAEVTQKVHTLPNSVTDINIFATTNPAHTFYIASGVFKTGGRDSYKRIRVYQQNSKEWIFEEDDYVETKL